VSNLFNKPQLHASHMENRPLTEKGEKGIWTAFIQVEFRDVRVHEDPQAHLGHQDGILKLGVLPFIILSPTDQAIESSRPLVSVNARAVLRNTSLVEIE